MEASIDRAEYVKLPLFKISILTFQLRGQQLNLGPFTCYLARYFQILDDYLNITSKTLVSATVRL